MTCFSAGVFRGSRPPQFPRSCPWAPLVLVGIGSGPPSSRQALCTPTSSLVPTSSLFVRDELESDLVPRPFCSSRVACVQPRSTSGDGSRGPLAYRADVVDEALSAPAIARPTHGDSSRPRSRTFAIGKHAGRGVVKREVPADPALLALALEAR
jgi:hypothetical protein